MKKENIYNLTSLWKTAGQALNSYYENPQFNYSMVKNSDWPNRIWLNDELNNKILKSIREIILKKNVKLVVPYWFDNITNSNDLFESAGFQVKLNQTGMSIKLLNKYDYQKRLLIREVDNLEKAKVWEEIYPDSFNYRISKEILMATKEKIKYYLAFLDNKPIGTAIVYITNNIAGIHGVGVIPSARRMGYADEIMKSLLNNLIDRGLEYSTLQASNMGLGIYKKMGYQEDFSITSYVLKDSISEE